MTAVALSSFAATVFAKDYLVPVPPAAPFPDPETATNVSFNATRNDTRRFGVTLELAGSVSNCVDVAAGRRYEETASGMPGVRRISLSVATDGDLVPVRAGITNETGACFPEIAAGAPRWFFRPEWNLMKVTRRGLDADGAWCRVKSAYNSFRVVVR